ncbi:uncharacterized mitochondrial protein-like protein [Tanacetum coccineum]
MHKKFKMSSMGELTFFLGLQVQQKKDGIFISQDKYVVEILKKFGFTEVKTTSTPMETQNPLLKDENGKEVDVHMYRSMIGSLMYLTSSRPDIMFAVCACARYQVNPKVSHLHAVKRIFRYLKGQPKLGLWYLKDSLFDLVAYTNSDYAGASLDRKSTTRGCQFLRCRLISWQCKKQTVVANSTTKAEYVVALSCYGQVLWIQNQLLDYGYNFMHTKIFIDNNRKSKKSVKLIMEKLFRMELELMLVTQTIPTNPHHTPTFIQPSPQPQKIQQPRKPKRKDTQVPQPSDPIENVIDKAVHKELSDNLVRAATTASSLEAKHDIGNINKTQSKATPNESSSLGTTSGGGPRCPETMGDTIAQTRVLDLDKTKTTQQDEIASLKRRVKRLKKKNRSRTHKLKRLYKVGLTAKVESSDNEESLGKDASKQLQAQEQDEVCPKEEKATLLSTTLREKKIAFCNLKEQRKRNKPPYKSSKRQIIAFKTVNTFENYRTEMVEGKEKKAGTELVQEITKKQKVEDDKETAELKQLMKIIPNEEEVAIDAIPLAVKSSRLLTERFKRRNKKLLIT